MNVINTNAQTKSATSLATRHAVWPTFPLLCLLALAFSAIYQACGSVPAAPSLLGPANGANVVVPFTNSWSAVLDPTAANGGYNWQVSATPDFASILYQNGTFPSQTQDVLSGIPNGTYYWRVQGVDNGLVAGPWSATETFTVIGASSAEPAAPVLNPPQAYNTFHPVEAEYWSASTVPGAATYTFEFSTNADFAPSDPTTTKFDNLGTPNMSFSMGFEGNFYMRARAVSASGFKSVPSNVQTFSVFFNNPIGPAPVIVSPVNNPTLTLPITFTWDDVPNPQPSGYTIEIADDSAFSSIEEVDNQITDTNITGLSLTSGQKFWRVFSTQGDSGPDTPANTAFSATGIFTIPDQTAVPVSVTIPFNPFPSGNQTFVAVQLATAPPNGATIQMTSSDPKVIPVPATITMQSNLAWMQFQVQAGNVTSPEAVTLTATLNGVSASGSCTVTPPAVRSVQFTAATVAGGTPLEVFINLDGAAPPSGATVSLSSSSPAVSVPATFTIQPGFFSGGTSAATSPVTANTPVTITATYNGATAQAQATLGPQIPPASIRVCPNELPSNGSLSASGILTFASLLPYQEDVALTSSDPTDVTVDNFVQVSQGFISGGFNVQAQPTTGTKTVTISASAGGQTQSTTIVLNPTGTEVTASTLTLDPSTVVGGNSTTGTVTLSGPAPTGGAVVSLRAGLTSVGVPASVTVPAGSTNATFPVTTSEVGSQVVMTISAEYNCGFASAGLTINPDPATTVANISAFQLNPISVTGGDNSTGTVVLNSPAPSGGAVVSISSADSSIVAVPSSVTVAAGATSASFTVTTASVSTTDSVDLTATYLGVVAPAILTVLPGSSGSGPTVASVTLNPSTEAGGSSSTGTVALSGAAPSGGAVVSLSSSDTAVASAPASVTIAAGATSAAFTITTVPVASSTTVTISGSYNASTQNATLTVTPIASGTTLSSLTLSPDSVTGGSSSTGTVTLSGQAPRGGAVVTLSSGDPSVATVPASVTVPRRATSATFTVTTASVSANQPVSISGAYNGTTFSAALTVTPAVPVTLSSLTLNPTSVTGGNSSTGTVTLSGAAPSGGAVVSLTSGNTSVATVPSSVTVAAGATSSNFTVTTVSVTGNQSVTISGTYNGTTQNATLTVTPAAAVTLSSLTLNPTSVTGRNDSTGTVTLSGPAPSGGATVALSSGNTSVATVPSSVTVSAGATSANFTVTTQRVRSNTTVTISGTLNGTTASATLTVTSGF